MAAHKLNRFQVELVRVGLAWVARGCHETVKNGGNCIDELHRAFGREKREAYCAQLAWVVAEQAARAAGINNPLPHTGGACDMLKRSVAAGLRVDKTPAIGAVFYQGSNPKYSTGHIGVVIDVTGTTIRTVEGNNDDRIDDWRYPMATVLNRPRTQACQRGIGWDFIHIEDAGGQPTESVLPSLSGAGPSMGSLLLIAGVAVGTFYTLRQAHHEHGGMHLLRAR